MLFTFTELFLFAAAGRSARRWSGHRARIQARRPCGSAFANIGIAYAWPLHGLRIAGTDLTEDPEELTIETSTLIAAAPDLAIDQTLAVYERFNWTPARATLVEDQRRLIERRL